MNVWDENLPDVSKWHPRQDAAENLSNLFFKHCQNVEERIILRAKIEKRGNVDNFDSGSGIEDIIRDELSQLLPKRYAVRSGLVDDRYGKTAGHCDIVVFNEHWFPSIRPGAIGDSRRSHFPIEGVYSIFEIKSALNYASLDAAMEKLVICNRLHRPTTPSNRVSENRWVTACPHRVSNPLYTVILAIELTPQISFEDLINRYFAICSRLPRSEVVRALCVFGYGTVLWGIKNLAGEIKPALFSDDYEQPIMPIYCRADYTKSALYHLANDLILNLYHSILSPEDLQTKYGLGSHKVSISVDSKIKLPPGVPPQVLDPEGPNNPWDQ